MTPVSPGSGKAYEKEMTRLSKRSTAIPVNNRPGAKPKPGVGRNAGGHGLLKPQGRSAPKVKLPSRTGRQFPGSIKKGGR